MAYERLIILLFSALLLNGCISIEGQSSNEMKKNLTKSYLFTSANRFYPDGVSSNDDLYPKLGKKQIKEINREYEELMKVVVKLHETKYGSKINTPEILISNNNEPFAAVNSDSSIEVDVKVVQGIYRGSLIDSLEKSDEFFTEDFIDKSDIIGKGPEAQAELINAVLAKIKEVESMPSNSIVGDMFGMFGNSDFDDNPWFYFSGVSMASKDIMNRHIGASLFLLAHEFGHIALNHHKRLDGTQSEKCKLKYSFELEADSYAVDLLSEMTGQLPMDFLGLSSLAGYETFFDYAYQISGFKEGKETVRCPYPTKESRLAIANSKYKAALEYKNEKLWQAIEESFNKQIESQN